MEHTPARSHADVVAAVRQDLERRGYVVDAAPSVPELGGLRPDLVARKADDVVVVEVKLAGEPTHGHSLAEIARAVERVPGWRFVLATGANGGTAELDILRSDEIARAIADGRQLPEHSRASALVAWAALEGALRAAFVRDGYPLPATASAKHWIQLAASYGLVSPAEERRLYAFAELRNRLAHGLRVSDGLPEHVPASWILDLAERLLVEARAGAGGTAGS
jgi:hypothetical protein